MVRRSCPAASWVLAALLGFAFVPAAGAQDSGPPRPSAPAFAAAPEDGQWTMPQQNFAATRYSDLSEIDRTAFGAAAPPDGP